MAVILTHDLTGEASVLEDGVAWTFGASALHDFQTQGLYHRMIVKGRDERFAFVDDMEAIGYCCDVCDGPLDPTPQSRLNDVVTASGWLATGDVLGFANERWRVTVRRGPASPYADLFRFDPPAKPQTFQTLLHGFELAARADDAGEIAASIGGLLRFVHHGNRRAEVAASFLRVLPIVLRAGEERARAAAAALAVALVRAGAVTREQAGGFLDASAEDASLDEWVRIVSLATMIAADAGPRDARTRALRALVLAALEEGDAPAAVGLAAPVLARVLDEDGTRSLVDAARAVSMDASAKKRRALAVRVLAPFAERSADASRFLLLAAGDPHEQVRAECARALASVPGSLAERALFALLGDADDAVFEAAFASLWRSTRTPPPPETLLAEIDRATGDATRTARLTQAFDRLA